MWSTWPHRIAVLMSVAIALFWIITPTSQTAATQVALNQLAGMTSTQVEAFIAAHPDLGGQLINSAPKEMAKWWVSQSASEKAKLIRTLPDGLGDLDGIDYASRDQMNRAFLAETMRSTTKQVAKTPGDAQAVSTLAALKAIEGALKGKHTPERHLISFTDDQPPLAAVAIGDLDTARVVTFNVPGMGTYTNDMQLWTQSAQNVYDQQGLVGGNHRRAVVAWIGYKTPPPGVDATLGEYASRGGPLLAEDIVGLTASRSARKTVAPVVNVVAHSYGTTTAADALAENKLGIYSFVMLGSAGIENNIAHASDLHAAHVYSGEASKDPEAAWGRLSRHDPRAPGFGATVIEVDGDPRLDLLPVTGHAPILHSEWNDDPLSSAWSKIKNAKVFEKQYLAHESTFGYLDNGTESLFNTAIATTPSANESLTNSRSTTRETVPDRAGRTSSD